MTSFVGSSKIGGASLLKEINRNVVLNEIRKNGPISRAELVECTGLGFPTVLRIVNALIEEKYIQEIGKGGSAAGRKPIMLTINPKAAYILGIRIGHRVIVILTDFIGNIVDEHLENADLKDGPESIADMSYEIVKMILDRNHLNLSDVAGIGIATPGVDFKTCDKPENKDTFACWQSANADEIFFRKFESCLVKIEFVTICGAIGEQWFGKTKNSKNNIYVYVDKGVGSGLIIDGKVYRGKDGFAGHIGHSIIKTDGDPCYCGNNGCLETYTSSTYIVRKVQKSIAEGNLSSLTETNRNNNSKITFNSIVTAAQQGDQLCNKTLQEAGEALGIGLANVINCFNPEIVVLGGEVCWSCPIIVDTAISIAKDNIFSNRARNVSIVVSDLTYRSEAKGAVALIMNEVYRSPDM